MPGCRKSRTVGQYAFCWLSCHFSSDIPTELLHLSECLRKYTVINDMPLCCYYCGVCTNSCVRYIGPSVLSDYVCLVEKIYWNTLWSIELSSIKPRSVASTLYCNIFLVFFLYCQTLEIKIETVRGGERYKSCKQIGAICSPDGAIFVVNCPSR